MNFTMNIEFKSAVIVDNNLFVACGKNSESTPSKTKVIRKTTSGAVPPVAGSGFDSL